MSSGWEPESHITDIEHQKKSSTTCPLRTNHAAHGMISMLTRLNTHIFATLLQLMTKSSCIISALS